uniref:Uncharacterized protein n=1 Tax=Tanacetum cinerariifolium TaxID=118510 RepID=A0A6L2NNU6_TANCI|nr:hypothetical protein [Tanacetum cinerariifolium]
MMVNAQEEVGDGLGFYTDSYHTTTDTQPSLSKPQKKIKPKRKQRQATKVHSPNSKIPVEESVLDLQEAKTSQAKEIATLNKRVKKLEKRRKSIPIGLRRLKKRRMHDANLFGVDDLEGNEVSVHTREKIVEKEVSTVDLVTTVGEVVTAASVEDNDAPTTTTTANVDDELTLAKTLISIKAAKLKLEAEMKAKIEEEERIAKEKDEANRAIIKERDDVQATIDADREDLEVLRSIIKERFKKTNQWKVLLVYKVTAVFNKVNAAKSRVTTAVRVFIARWIKWLEGQDILKRLFHFYKVYKERKRLLYVKRNKAISLGKGASKVDIEDFQDKPDDEKDTRSGLEYLKDIEEEYQASALLSNSKRQTKDFKSKYNKVKAKLALLSSSASARSSSSSKNKGLIAETYDWDEEEVPFDDNEVTEVKSLWHLLMKSFCWQKNARNGEWIKISMKKDVNTEILKENQNLRNELKNVSSITKAWLNSSNKVSQCISEKIPTQKKKILRIDQLTKDTFSSRPKDMIFVMSLIDNVSITDSNKPKLSEAEYSALSNHNANKVSSVESQRKTTDPLVVVTESLVTIYDSANESSVCSTLLAPLKKLDGVEHVFGPKIIK